MKERQNHFRFCFKIKFYMYKTEFFGQIDRFSHFSSSINSLLRNEEFFVPVNYYNRDMKGPKTHIEHSCTRVFSP